jgi:hypothetical protein
MSESDAHTFPCRWRTAVGWSFARIEIIYRIQSSIAEIAHILKIPKILGILILTKSEYICNPVTPLIGGIGVQTNYHFEPHT